MASLANLSYYVQNPESWRLACQTTVGNKENSGKVVSKQFIILQLPLSMFFFS
jgi:hypothetical protein